MYLVADLGNTLIKLALFDQKELLQLNKFDLKTEYDSIQQFIETVEPKTPCIISSVISKSTELETLLSQRFRITILNTKTTLPIVNCYNSPKTLGDDRLANAVAASATYQGKNVLVVDMGTCIKYDFITKNAEYLGGAISPGIKMRFNSLYENTGRLPLLESNNETPLTGKTTQESILSGVLNGIRFEIEGAIQQYSDLYESLTIVFTGGDHQRFVKEIKYPIFARPNLTLEGLYYILKINEIK